MLQNTLIDCNVNRWRVAPAAVVSAANCRKNNTDIRVSAPQRARPLRAIRYNKPPLCKVNDIHFPLRSVAGSDI